MALRLAARIVVVVPLLLALGACAGRTGMELDLGEDGETSGDGETAGEDGETSGEDGETSGEDGEPLPSEFCVDACVEITDGSCLTPEACVSYCEAESDAWEVELGEAFAECARTNPVCYETIESCMFNVLHPPGTAFDLRLRGAGLDAHEGKTIRAWYDPGADPGFAGEAQISDGAFELAWFEAVPTVGLYGPLILIYVDLDGDGGCDPEVDLTASEYLVWNGSYDAPAFELTVTAPLGPAGFVCGYLP